MGSILSALGSLSSSLCACNENQSHVGNVFCCISRNVSLNTEQKENSRRIRSNFSGSDTSSDEFKDELTVNCDDTFLRKHHITQTFYINKNIGYFITDTKGVFTYVSDNMIKFIGLPHEKILQSISWVGNVKNNYSIYKNWVDKINEKKKYVGKMHFELKNKHHRYIIFEFWPIIDDVNYAGVSGIFLNVEKHAWQIFDETDINR